MSNKINNILDAINYIPVEVLNMTLDEIMRSADVNMSSTFNKDGSLRNLNIKSTVDGFMINVNYKEPKKGK